MIRKVTTALAALALMAGLAGVPANAALAANTTAPVAQAPALKYQPPADYKGPLTPEEWNQTYLEADRIAEGRAAAKAQGIPYWKYLGWDGPPKQKPPAERDEKAKAGKRATPCPTTFCYFYATAFQADPLTDKASGTSMVTTTSKPFVSAAHHSIGQFAAFDSTKQDIIEMGWVVAPSWWRADGVPVLFTSQWDGPDPDGDNWMGYNNGWVDNASQSVNLGTSGLGTPANHTYRIVSDATHFHAEWQAGRIASLAKSVFTWGGAGTGLGAATDSISRTQYYWEIAGTTSDPCTDMSNGNDANPIIPSTPKMDSFTLIGSTDAIDITINHNSVAGSLDALNAVETPTNVMRGGGGMYSPTGGVGGPGCT